MEEDSTADMQFARRTPGRFLVGDGSAGTEKAGAPDGLPA